MSDYLGAVSDVKDYWDLAYSAADEEALVLLDSDVQLKQLRNRHEALVNTLPVEILAHIFHLFADRTQPILACDKGPSGTYQRATILASVCYQWRRVTLGIHTLWSLISFFAEDCHQVDNPLARLWLERSANSPLHLIISHESIHEPITIAPMLIPHANRFRTLSIVADSPEDISEIMTVWLDYGAPGSVTELRLFTRSEKDFPTMLDIHQKYSPESIDKYLRPVQILQLKNVYLDWDSAAYEGLLSLRLGETIIRMTQFAKILNASPCLNSLFLKNILFLQRGSALLPSLISLPDLRTLYIDDIAPEYMGHIFHLIQPGLHYDVHLNVSPLSLPLNETESYLNMSRLNPIFSRPQIFNIVSLSLGKHCEPDSLRTFLRSLPHLRVLYLHDTGALYDTATLNAMTRILEQEPIGINESSSASLQAIHIMGTILDSDAFKAMILSYSLQQLSLARWTGNLDDNDGDGDGDTNIPGPTEELCTWASTHVPDFVCYGVGKMALRALRLHPFIWRIW
ncbi:hypothetical protein FRC09_005468 [Ceratobasidium sp. 395]|nr:hypothetical protein FRC09_005468 [Ceratobasidium sp. 395]